MTEWTNDDSEGYLPSFRQFQEDFETEGYQLDEASLNRRPDAISPTFRHPFALGPFQLSDPSRGLVERPWAARIVENEVQISRSNGSVAEIAAGLSRSWGPWTTLFTFDGDPIIEMDLGFDQNGAAYIVAERADGGVWLYWPNPLQGGLFVFEKIADGWSPRILLDDPENAEESDVLVFYCDDEGVHWRAQREVFGTPYLIPNEFWSTVEGEIVELDPSCTRLQDAALSTGRRLVLLADEHDDENGTYRLLVRETAPYPVYMEPEDFDASQEMQHILSEQVSVFGEMQAEFFDTEHRLSSLIAEELVLIQLMDDESFDVASELSSFMNESMVLVFELNPESFDVGSEVNILFQEVIQFTYDRMELESIDLVSELNSLMVEAV